MDCLRAFPAKLQNWQRKVGAGNVAMLENLSAVLDENEDRLLDPLLKTEVTQYLKSLESELKMCFPEFEEEEEKLVRNPFSILLPFPVMFRTDFLISKLILLLKISMKKDLLKVFWCSMYQSHPKVSEAALRLLLPFSTTHWCESGFSTLLQIKNKSRNRLDVDPDMRCALSAPQPRIRRLTEKYDVSLLIGVW